MSKYNQYILFLLSPTKTVAADYFRDKRQDEDESESSSVDELCDGRPADEYFRTSTEGDCRDVYRYNPSNIL